MTNSMFTPLSLNLLIPGAAENPFRRDELAQTSYRPTIVIGLGGTGLAIVRRLKRLLRRYYRGEEMDIFQFIVFDTAAQEVPDGEDLLDAGEFVYLGAFDAADMIRHLDENPYIARWWPGGKERPYRPSFSGTGANRVRALGRLVLYNYASNTIIPRLEAKIDRAIEINAQHGLGATSIKFYIIYSLPGGTGSGMGLDLAYLARMMGLRRQPTAYTTGILVMDDAFLPKAHTEYTRAEFRANTLAALKEINHFASTRHFYEVYDDITSTAELPDGFRPFDITYLMGLHNAEGQALESFESLADMIAAEVMLEIASPLHGRTENVLDNVRANERSIAGQPAAYSSFALSSLVFPLQGVASWCALSSFADFTRKALLTPRRSPGEIDGDVLAFMQTTAVEQEQAAMLTDHLNQDERGEAMSAPSLSHDLVAGLPDEQLLGAVQRMQEGALAELARQRETLMRSAPGVQKAFQLALSHEAETALRDVERGPQYLAWFLEKLEERLSTQRDRLLLNEQAIYRAEADAQEAAWRADAEALGQIVRLPRWLPWRNWQLNTSRSHMVTSFNAYTSAALDLERRTQALLCSAGFLQVVRDLRLALNALLTEWNRLAQVTQERAEAQVIQARATETEYSLMRNIIGPEELRRLPERHAMGLEEEAGRSHMAGLFWRFFDEHYPEWRLYGANKPSGEFSPPVQSYYFLANWYAGKMSGQGLLERLREIFGTGWEREIELRYRQTSPFWNYNLSRFGDKIRNNLQNEPRLVGYGEDNAPVWSGTVAHATGEPVDGVNNKNPHQMVFLNTAHGLPLFALRSINQTLRTAYQYIRQLWDEAQTGSNPIPAHISSVWDGSIPEIDPQPVSVNTSRVAQVSGASNGRQGHVDGVETLAEGHLETVETIDMGGDHDEAAQTA